MALLALQVLPVPVVTGRCQSYILIYSGLLIRISVGPTIYMTYVLCTIAFWRGITGLVVA